MLHSFRIRYDLIKRAEIIQRVFSKQKPVCFNHCSLFHQVFHKPLFHVYAAAVKSARILLVCHTGIKRYPLVLFTGIARLECRYAFGACQNISSVFRPILIQHFVSGLHRFRIRPAP